MGAVRSVLMLPVRVVTGVGAVSVGLPAALAAAGRLPADAARVIEAATDLVIRIENLTAEVDRVASDVRRTAAQTAEIVDEARQAVLEARGAIERVDLVVDEFRPAMRDAAPLLTEFTARATTRNVAAVVDALDVLPELTGLVVPAVRNLVELIPELDLVIERLDNVGKVVEGLPGARLLMRRAEAAAADS
jgi:hypothetical protein